MCSENRRFIIACLIPFLCIFAATLVTNNAIFALDGMINHTATEYPLNDHNHSTDHDDTCVEVPDDAESCHPSLDDGPFPWDDGIEALVNLIIAVGSLGGTLLTLFVYDFINSRFVFSFCLMYAGLLNILSPPFSTAGGYPTLVTLRFFTGIYVAVLYPAVPVLMKSWFLDTELCRMNVVVFIGMEFGRIFFCLSGTILENKELGWEFLYYFPGGVCVFLGFVFAVFLTDDPLESLFISRAEKELLARNQLRKYTPSMNVGETRVTRYRRNIKFFKKREVNVVTPWRSILMDPVFLLSTWQYTCQCWVAPVMTLMVKKYVEEIHGYSLSEAAILVTIPTNLGQIVTGYVSALLGDIATKKNVSRKVVRIASGVIAGAAAIPYLLMPFLPCHLLNYRATIAIIQILGSFRVVGNLAGYTTFRDISPTFNRQLFALASLIAVTVPNVMVPLFMGWFRTTSLTMWQYNFATNATIMITGNWLYCTYVRTEPASWDPASKAKSGMQANLLSDDSDMEVYPHGGKPYGTNITDHQQTKKEQPQSENSTEL